MAQEFTFPQNQDRDDAEHFASMIGQDNLSDYVETGLGFTYNSAGPSVDVSQGKAFISLASDTATTSGEEILDVNHVVQVPAQTVSLAGTAVNYVYLEPNFGSDDAATVSSYTTEQTGNSLLIGTIDTSTDDVTELNRNPDLSAKRLGLGDDADSYVWEYNSSEGALTLEDDTGTRLADVTSSSFDVSVDLRDGAGNVIYNQSGGYVEQTRLQNDTVTVAGNAVSLGGSVAVDHADLSNVGSADHHTRYSDEEAQDAVGTILSADFNYDDATPAIDMSPHAGDASAHHTRYADSEAQSAVTGNVNVEDLVTASATAGQVARSQGDGTLLMESLGHGDLANVSSNDHHSRYTDSEAQTAINNDADHGSTAPHNYFSGSHNDLTNVAAGDHHTRYADEEAQDATGAMAGNALTYDDATPALNVDETAISHDNLANVSASDHHTKTTSLADISDADPSEIRTGTLANRPTAGTAGRWYQTTDNNGIYYDDGAAWQLIAEYPGNIAAGDLGFDPATQTELNNHAGDAAAHHSRYTDSEAQTAINNDTDHGSTAPHNYFSGSHNDLTNVASGDHHTRYADSEARNAVTGNVNVEDLVTASATAGHVARSQGDGTLLMENLGHGDLTGISSNDHHSRYTDSEAQTAINNDADHGSTAPHNYFSGSHNDLTNVASGDHHTRYADSEAVSAVESQATLYLSSLDLDNGDQGIYIHDGTGNFNIKSGVAQGSDNIVSGSGGSEIQMNESGEITLKVDETTAAGNAFTSELQVNLGGGNISFSGPTSGISHDNLSGVSSGDHHSRYTDSEAQTAINNDTDHGSTAPHNYFSGSHTDLTNVGASDHHSRYADEEAQDAVGTILSADFNYDDATPAIDISPHTGDASAHHSRYTDSEAQTAINNDTDHGSTAPHNYFSGSHADLTNITSNDHHAKYTDSEARNAVTGNVDAANLTGGSGTSGQVLTTDGTSASWGDVSGGFDGTTDYLSVTARDVIDVGNHGFPGDQTGGDLAQFVADNTSAGSYTVFILPRGTYQWERPVLFNGGTGTHDEPIPEHFALIGKPEATLAGHMPTGSERLFFRLGTSANGLPQVNMQNIHFDIGTASDSRDAGIHRAYISDQAYFENITLSRRKKVADDGTSNGDRHTFKIDCINEDARAVMKDVRFPNGDVYQSSYDSVGHAIPFASEPSHVGNNYWINCYVEGFTDNGFYVRDGHGSNNLLGCTAKNCSAGMFRIGRNDYMENCTAIANSNLSYNGTPLWIQEHRDAVSNSDQSTYTPGDEDDEPIVVKGFNLLAEGGPVNDIIRITSNPTEVRLDGGYIRCRVDEYLLDCNHYTGKVSVDGLTVDDHATGNTRLASIHIDGPNIQFDNFTYRAHPPDTENGRSVFYLDNNATRCAVRNSDIQASYYPLVEAYSGSEFTMVDTVGSNSASSPYLVRLQSTPMAYLNLRYNDLSDYTGGLNASTGNIDNYHIIGNEGIGSDDQGNVWTDQTNGIEVRVDGNDGTGILNIITGN